MKIPKFKAGDKVKAVGKDVKDSYRGKLGIVNWYIMDGIVSVKFPFVNYSIWMREQDLKPIK